MSFPCQWCWCRSTRRDTRASGVAFTPRRVRVSTRLEPAGCGFQRVWDPAGLGFKLFETRRFRFSNKMAGFRRVTRLPGLPWIPGPCLVPPPSVVGVFRSRASALLICSFTHSCLSLSFTSLSLSFHFPNCLDCQCRSFLSPTHCTHHCLPYLRRYGTWSQPQPLLRPLPSTLGPEWPTL
jgi:hypothetical protein